MSAVGAFPSKSHLRRARSPALPCIVAALGGGGVCVPQRQGSFCPPNGFVFSTVSDVGDVGDVGDGSKLFRDLFSLGSAVGRISGEAQLCKRPLPKTLLRSRYAIR